MESGSPILMQHWQCRGAIEVANTNDTFQDEVVPNGLEDVHS